MRKKNHYDTLGVKRSADDWGIRAAFRELAKKYHPDISGPEQTRGFQEILEAYSVLLDPQSRSAYNRLLEEKNGPRLPRKKARSGEPLQAGKTLRFTQTSFRGSHAEPGAGGKRFFEFLSNDFPERRSQCRRFPGENVLDVEVVLSREEARLGGVLPLWYPCAAQCLICGGRGVAGRILCSACGGRGVVLRKKGVNIELPAGIEDGSLFDVAVGEPGSQAIVLRLHFFVGKR
ncbi:MAG: DnaJ domain-containing protein [Syntrophobacteraceae bacterium]|nr:DnaJ domain-containing protein [Syntrophobacteraceae bacterium]